ncbi:recombinase family protein [Nioella nitratireducens]|uniref:recombinase family protein n=1 Tax=Nioella nitratireducens TaxID=1287720 RepID=UPI0008FD8C78|nr:recombinase family protein [Nioella nitratireducens]
MNAYKQKSIVAAAIVAPSVPRLFIAYLRVSSDGQGESGVGLAAQLAGIKEFVKARDGQLLFIFEEVASARGANNMSRRPRLTEALKAAAQKGATLIVYDWERLTRAESDRNAITAILPADRIQSVREDELLSSLSAPGRLAYAQKRGEAISRSTKEGMARKKALEGVTFGNPEIKSLQPKGTEAAREKALRLREAVADVLEKHGGLDHGLSNHELADILNKRGMQTGQNKPFTNRTIVGPLKGAEEILTQRLNTCSGATQEDENSTEEEHERRPAYWGRF